VPGKSHRAHAQYAAEGYLCYDLGDIQYPAGKEPKLQLPRKVRPKQEPGFELERKSNAPDRAPLTGKASATTTRAKLGVCHG
jgi:hypothetical protein